MITYLFLLSVAVLIRIPLGVFPLVDSVPFNLDHYLRVFSSTFYNLGLYFPPIATFYNLVLVFVNFYLLMFMWYWGLRIFRLIRG